MCIATGGDTKKAPAFSCKCLNHKGLSRPFPWSHLGLNQGPPDYESGATNQLSYGTVFRFFYFITASCRASSFLTTARLLRQSSLAFLVLPQNKLQKNFFICHSCPITGQECKYSNYFLICYTQTLISTSTPLGSSSFMRASTVFWVES